MDTDFAIREGEGNVNLFSVDSVVVLHHYQDDVDGSNM